MLLREWGKYPRGKNKTKQKTRMINEYKHHDFSANICQSQHPRYLDLKAVQGTEDKALGPYKVKSWKWDPYINSEVMNQERKASNESRDEKETCPSQSESWERKKFPLENKKLQSYPQTVLDFEFVLQQGLRILKPRKKGMEIPSRKCFRIPG